MCLRSPERFAFSPSRLRCSRSGAPPTRCGRRAAGTLGGVWSGCRRATVSPAARILRRLPIASQPTSASVLDAAQSAVAHRTASNPSSSRRERLACGPSAMRSREPLAGVVDDRASPAHRTTSESETLRSSRRLRLGRHRHRRGRSVTTSSVRHRPGDISHPLCSRRRAAAGHHLGDRETPRRTRRAQRGTTPQRTPRDNNPAAPPRSGGHRDHTTGTDRPHGGDAVDAAGGDGSRHGDGRRERVSRTPPRSGGPTPLRSSSRLARRRRGRNRRARPVQTLRHHADHTTSARRRRRAARRAASSSNGPRRRPPPRLAATAGGRSLPRRDVLCLCRGTGQRDLVPALSSEDASADGPR